MNGNFLVYSFSGLISVLFAIVAFFSKETYKSLRGLNVNMNRLQVDMSTLKVRILSEDRIREITRMEILNYHETHRQNGNKL